MKSISHRTVETRNLGIDILRSAGGRLTSARERRAVRREVRSLMARARLTRFQAEAHIWAEW